MPSALSTSRTPSGVAVNDVTDGLHYSLLDLAKRSANARTGSQSMTAAPELLAYGTNIDRGIFRAHADPDLTICQFLEEDRDDNPAYGADVIDQALIILRNDVEGCCGR